MLLRLRMSNRVKHTLLILQPWQKRFAFLLYLTEEYSSLFGMWSLCISAMHKHELVSSYLSFRWPFKASGFAETPVKSTKVSHIHLAKLPSENVFRSCYSTSKRRPFNCDKSLKQMLQAALWDWRRSQERAEEVSRRVAAAKEVS